ncbi:protein-(glutamine-N5) methyltransferase, release factor-specific [Enemella evansiae]|uniref:Release factor glutamine methyltransferase n=1 Tax=Enemella evansiae TaxID=2016499 RepID=A0A255GN18_9ACTN|nr:peptide chain release factor N(5)-glutamine methyltransferase [Enemella evansiae]OYO14384.1 protein-(glutamine-N5) methyltransferase, release factor-specific [Enemella evansiae]
MRVPELIRAAAARLPGVSADAEARTLLAHVLGVPTTRLVLADDPTADQQALFEELVAERAAGRPLQHLTGAAHFRTVRLAVGPGVFVPRPETEVMTGWALDRLAELRAAGTERPRVVEPCTGSGAISLALHAEAPETELHAVELSEEAYAWAARNLTGTGVDLRQGDMADAFGDLDGTVDLVICNPPYIPLTAWEGVPAEVRDHDPELALFSGTDGLDAIRVLTDVAARLLRPGGLVCAEHAEVQQRSAAEVFLAHGGFDQVRDHRDLTDRPRFVTARRR